MVLETEILGVVERLSVLNFELVVVGPRVEV
jgi:hypothetical protein